MRKSLLLLTVIIVNVLLAVSLIVLAEEPPNAPEQDTRFPELSAFHEVLAPIWHTHYPANDWAAIRQAAPQLVAKMQALKNAKLPPGLALHAAAYQPKLEALQQAVNAVAAAAQGADDEKLKQAVMQMHHAYHAIVMVLYGNE